ncbi:hypothetical protein [Candidatus Electronema sp. TJ]|uniref:hypothetical protein n=1 Tax=Candidatus Electronema sp. TJ TaxID=3401573 RepID=UPI003AA7B290
MLVSLLALTAAATTLSGASSAAAETISGKIAAVTKNSKSATAEIIPDAPGGQLGHRYAVSTTFQEIGEMLMQAMETKSTVTIVSSGNCAAEGTVRDCGSVVTVERAQQQP